jgi:uncharacterized protein (TIGR00730 family)
MAQADIELVYGGGSTGVMGSVANAVLAAGGRVTGIIPKFLVRRESAQASLEALTEAIVTDDMHQRKHTMFERADAFVALPGGIGTLEEIIEIMTWAQLGRHTKPIAFANVAGFWDPLLALLDHMRREGFIHTANRVQPLVLDKAENIVPALIAANGRDASSRQGESAMIARL